MKSVVHRDWTYYIGGSGDPTIQVTPFKYCISEYSMDQSGNILNIPMFCIIANSRDFTIHNRNIYLIIHIKWL